MIHFAIRDDDTCFFTQPEQITGCYQDIWDFCPISLSVVPFHACAPSGALPRRYWRGDEVFPLHRNKALVKFLREGIRDRRLYACLHGYDHSGSGDAGEFASGKGLLEKVVRGQQYLEDLLGQEIKVFVPPHNSLDRDGFRAVIGAGMHISGIQTHRPGFRGMDPRIFWIGACRRWRQFGRKGFIAAVQRYPDGHREIPYESIIPDSSFQVLVEEIRQAADGAVFCPSLHYWEFDRRGDRGGATIRETLNHIMAEIRSIESNVQCHTLGSLCGI